MASDSLLSPIKIRISIAISDVIYETKNSFIFITTDDSVSNCGRCPSIATNDAMNKMRANTYFKVEIMFEKIRLISSYAYHAYLF